MLYSLPNILTISRILAIPLIVALFWVKGDAARWAMLALFALAGVTDYFDGMLARSMGNISSLGRFLDPVADKLLVSALLIMLVWSGNISGLVILPALVILCREILVSGLREFLAGIKVGVPVSNLAKWKTAVQMFALGFLIVGAAGPDGSTERRGWPLPLLSSLSCYSHLQCSPARRSHSTVGSPHTHIPVRLSIPVCGPGTQQGR